MLLKISYKNLLYNRTKLLMSLLLLASGSAVLLLVQRLEKNADKQLAQNLAGIDMVLGAKGSPLQLILSAVYHIDDPTGNISYAEAKQIAENPAVENAIPMAYGDNFEGYRIIGTEQSYLDLYGVSYQEGEPWKETFEVCLGYDVAKRTGLIIGSQFLSSHGLSVSEKDPQKHTQLYIVKGILKKNNSIIDRLVFTNLSSVWSMHQDADTNTSKKQITAMLVKFKNKQALLNVPRSINDNTLMQAAVPSIELNRLRYLLESGSKTLQLVGYALLILAILSLMVTLLQLFEDRKYELALLKAQGASFNKLIMLLFTENIMLAVPGWFLGELIARIGFTIMNKNLNSSFHFTINPLEITGMDFYLLGLLVFFAMITALLPVLRLKKLNVITILSAN